MPADAPRTAQEGGESCSLLLTSVELSDTQVYGPQMRALLGTASHFCEHVVLGLRHTPQAIQYATQVSSRGVAGSGQEYNSLLKLAVGVRKGN